MKFSELNIHDSLKEAIAYMGFENLTPIQEKAIPIILDGKDLIACAQTGTGKTAAFVLPILNKLINKNNQDTDTLIIVPTRELAIQIEQQIQGLSYFLSVSSMAVYGGGDGKDWILQKEALMNGADIIVATPGKLLGHLQMGYVNFKKVKHLILDEADRMLDMGFIDDIQQIISYLPKERQTLLFSATMPNSIKSLVSKILVKPEEIILSISKPAEGVVQNAYLAYDTQKVALLTHILNERKNYDSIIIFTSAKLKINEIVSSLSRAGYKSQGISSNLDQDKREQVLQDFKSKKTRILVATDVMSRGIDVKEINMVINYDVPHDAEDYVHRVGRTARASTKGEAITLINPRDMYKFSKIEKLIEKIIPKLTVPNELGEAPTWNPEKEKSKPLGGNKRNFRKKSNQNNSKSKPLNQAQ
jgi:superfamily II DNA/RNA helicase